MPQPPDAPLRVVLADDHYLVREGTRQLLELDGQILVVASVENAEQLMTAVAGHRPDVVITDIRMPPTHTLEGIVAAHRLRQERSDLGIVVLSNHADPDYALELFKDGMAGLAYLLKDRVGDRSQLVAAVRAVAAGDSVIDPVVVEGLVHRRARQEASPLSRLTDRERDVLEGMAAGRTNAAISAHLHLSVSAVEKNVNSIFNKLGLTDEPTIHRRVGAVLAFLANPPR